MERYTAEELMGHGIQMIDPSAVFVSRDVDLSLVSTENVTLYPGARITGSGTVLSSGSVVGELGPVMLHDVALGAGAAVQRGSAEQTTLLQGAVLGPDAHARFGTILEEGASTGHAVGLKQTILGAFAAVGSNVNFCDAYLGGGRSREDHSEIGSGFIHFNFTPFGARGDKATASMFGSVPGSVMLNQDRVFLGGAGGVVGPVALGFGVVLAAGSVYRRDHPDGQLVLGEPHRARSMALRRDHVPGVARRLKATERYILQLLALEAWYRHVRLSRAQDIIEEHVLNHALARLSEGVTERIKQGARLVDGAGSIAPDSVDAKAVIEWEQWVARFNKRGQVAIPDEVSGELNSSEPHIAWVRSLSTDAVDVATLWLTEITEGSTLFTG